MANMILFEFIVVFSFAVLVFTDSTCIVRTNYGKVVGLHDRVNGVCAFKGIPYTNLPKRFGQATGKKQTTKFVEFFKLLFFFMLFLPFRGFGPLV